MFIAHITVRTETARKARLSDNFLFPTLDQLVVIIPLVLDLPTKSF